MTDTIYDAVCALCEQTPHTSIGTYDVVGPEIWRHQTDEHADDLNVKRYPMGGAYLNVSELHGDMVIQFTHGAVAITLKPISK